MSHKRVYISMVVLMLVLSIAIVAGTVVITSTLRNHSAKLVELKLEDSLIGEQQSALAAAKRDIDEYQELDAIARSIVPQDKDQARTVRDIVQIARDNNILIETINFPSSNLGDRAPATAQTNSEQGEQQQAAPPAISQAKPVTGIKGVYSLQLDISPSTSRPISYTELINFLSRLENNRRTAQISRLSITPRDARLTFNLSINIFIKP